MTTQPTAVIDRFASEHAFLSNFTPSPVAIRCEGERLVCPTVEHAFQAAKTLDPVERRRVAAAESPTAAKRLGRCVTLRPGWDEIRDDVMRACLAAKFRHGSALAERLVRTGDVLLVEGNTWGDRYWGVCDGIGENRLGELLMRRRVYLATLREYPDFPL